MAKKGRELILPSGPVNTPEKLAQRRHIQELFVRAMVEGDGDPMSVVRKLAGGDKRLYKRWRNRYMRWMSEPSFQELIGVAAKGEKIGGLIPASKALVRRASKGNVPAIKLLYEASGYWSPRTTQEHTGEIAITIKGTPRPASVVDEPIVDADVVEDTSE